MAARMAGSHLKQLKASLRERGRLGPTPSKKQKTQLKDARRRANQVSSLDSAPARKAKFEFVNAPGKVSLNKESTARELREQVRRDGILFEMQRRQKVGGIVDRRFGEDDPTMTPEERAMERFVREKQRSGRKSGVFDLEEDGDEEGDLTHLGRPLSLRDDFQDFLSDDDAFVEGTARGMKRRRVDENGEMIEQANLATDRQKTKKEVMEEVIAKSKLHKYERQKAKEEDDDLRAELDTGVGDIFALMRGRKVAPKVPEPGEITMNPERAALLNGQDRDEADREYDMRLRSMVQDKRSQPTTRTKTDEEKAEEAAARLKRLEEQRIRRMRGEVSEDEEEGSNAIEGDEDYYDEAEDVANQQAPKPVESRTIRTLLRRQNVEDEDDFELDDNLIANNSDLISLDSDEISISNSEEAEDSDQEFIADLLTTDETGKLELRRDNKESRPTTNGTRGDLAYTYICPQELSELLDIAKDVPTSDLPTAVQRIRALYHPQLAEGNKDKLSKFAAVLVGFIPYLVRQQPRPSLMIVESLIRHVHSLAKSHPESVSDAFREELRSIQQGRPTNLDAGDMVTLTAIGSIFPTSDHFHQVVTPANLTITRYLGESIPVLINDLVLGTYLSTLSLQYQVLSKRYIPEVVNYILNTLSMLAAESPKAPLGTHSVHDDCVDLRIRGTLRGDEFQQSISFWDYEIKGLDDVAQESLKLSLLNGQLQLIDTIVNQWSDKSAYPEIMEPFLRVLIHLSNKKNIESFPPELQKTVESTKISIEMSIKQAILARQPLALHHHRPLSIKMSIPKFEDSYNPDKRYDPVQERAESSKLRAEHRKERKAVIREFRKDARAEASVQLEEKKARDEAYEKKYRRLIAEIQGEEGRESKAYEREKASRKSKR